MLESEPKQPPRSLTESHQGSPALQLRVISWNLHGAPLASRRADRMQAAIAETLRRRSDVVFLQEVWYEADVARVARWLRAAAYDVVIPPLGFFGRHGGLLTAVRTEPPGWQVQEISFTAFAQAASRWRFWEGDGLATKGFQRVVMSNGDDACVLFNTHVQAEYGDERRHPRHTAVRRAQIEQLGVVVDAVGRSHRVVVCGDFNVHPAETELYHRILRNGIRDLTADLRLRRTGGTAYIESSQQTLWLDYVLGRGRDGEHLVADAQLVENHAPDDPYSDHHGIDVSVSFWRPDPPVAQP